MAVALLQLIDEFERLSLDDKIFFRIESEEELEVDILFERTNSQCRWSLWYALSKKNSKQTVSSDFLPQVIKAFQVSEAKFCEEVSAVLLTQAAFADEFVREVSNLIGAEAVRSAILQTQDFMEALRASVRGVLGESEPSAVPATVEANRARFRVIKPES